MAAADRTVTLYVPGLFSAVADARRLPSGSWPAPSALQTLLSRGRWGSAAATGFEPTLFELFGYSLEPDTDPPTAAICRIADGGRPDHGWWLRADPVHLHADQRSLIMVAHEELDLSREEAADLQSAVAGLFADQGWRWEMPAPSRWYLRLPQPARIRTHCLAATLGHDILARLPAGKDASDWHRHLNEVQMLLHAHPVNQTRMADGRLPANSLWFWGGGSLPPVAKAPWSRLRSDDFVAIALARYAGVEHEPLPDAAVAVSHGGSAADKELVVLDELYRLGGLGDPYAWLDGLHRLEQSWFAPLLASLRAGALGGLRLVSDDGRMCSADRADVRRWWRRLRPVIDFLSVAEASGREWDR